MDEKKHNILYEEDFIDYPKFKNSVSKLIEKYPDGVDDETIAKVLNISKEQLKNHWECVLSVLRKKLDK